MLIAAPVEELYLNNKSVVNILCNVSEAYGPYIVAGILNSKLGSFIFKHSGVKANRGLFPKVVIGDLQQFPVPREPNRAVLGRLEKAVHAMCGVLKRKGANEDEGSQSGIDNLVYLLYGLGYEEIATVEAETEVSVDAAN
jgi:hypothetical protein